MPPLPQIFLSVYGSSSGGKQGESVFPTTNISTSSWDSNFTASIQACVKASFWAEGLLVLSVVKP